MLILAKILRNLVSLSRKLDKPYCHTHHDWCSLTIKSNSLMARRGFLHQKTKLGQRCIKANIFFGTKAFITREKIIGNLLAYNSGTLWHLAVGLEFIREKQLQSSTLSSRNSEQNDLDGTIGRWQLLFSYQFF